MHIAQEKEQKSEIERGNASAGGGRYKQYHEINNRKRKKVNYIINLLEKS